MFRFSFERSVSPGRSDSGARAGVVGAALGLLLGLLLGAAPAAASETEDVLREVAAGTVGAVARDPRLVRRAIGSGDIGQRWSHGEIPYRIDAGLGPAAERAVDEAVARWNAVAGITFRALDPNEPRPADHLVFVPGDGCASWVGRQGGAQSVWIGPDCGAGSVMHELGHALGLEHEHTRADRDQHVRVHWERIRPEKRHNFETASSDTRLLGSYDLGSIMHYGPWNFSLDGLATLEAIDPLAGARMGQRDGPSVGDIAAIARLYGSDLSLVVQPDEARDTSGATLFVTNEYAQGAHGVTLSLRAPAAVVLPEGADAGDWRCERVADGLDCRLARLDGGARSELRVLFEEPLDPGELEASLGSKTPDVDSSNNVDPVLGAAPGLGSARGDKPAPMFGDAGDGGERVPREDGGSSGGGAMSMLMFVLAVFTAVRRRR